MAKATVIDRFTSKHSGTQFRLLADGRVQAFYPDGKVWQLTFRFRSPEEWAEDKANLE